MIVAQGGQFGGWCLYLLEGRPVYCYNLFGMQRFKVAAEAAVPQESTNCAWSSPTTAAVWPRAATSTLYLDGDELGTGRVEASVPLVFSADETTDVG